MNPAVSDKIELVLKHAQPAIRDELLRHLNGCGFVDPDDPLLNALIVQSAIVGQPVRLVEHGGAAVATEAGMSRLGDRFDDTAWSLARLRIGTVWLACLLSLGIGAGGVLLAFKIWPQSLAGVFDLPRATDDRLVTLSAIGATLHVKEAKGTTYVYFDGELQPNSGQAKSGRNYLCFKP
jgi:hypothetical protein